MSKSNGTTKLRAVGYCRTSGEGQRDNTSIPTQKKAIEDFCHRNDWVFLRHYVDEAKTGAKITGRNDFQQMMTDAALKKFDVIVPFDVSRFARDGVDILGSAKFLRSTFNINLVDTKGGFDSRPSGNVLLNFVNAGVSEHERLTIMGRTIRGRIRRVEEGKPWSGKQPFGRTFDKKTGKWFVNARGKRMRQLLERYADGEGLSDLVKEFTEFSSTRVVLTFINHSQLSGTYVKEFNIPELNIRALKIPVPAIPEVISPKLFARVQARKEHRRTWNQEHRRKYVLTGFVRCGHCGKPLTGNSTNGQIYYRHCVYRKAACVFHSIREQELVSPVLGYLYSFFTDEPTFTAAIGRALPTATERKGVETERDAVKAQLKKIEKQITRLVNAITAGADAGLLIGKQNELKAEHDSATERLRVVEKRLESMPNRERLKHQITATRLRLLEEVQERDWRKLPVDEIRRFLIFLFGQNPGKTGQGIIVKRENGRWCISFKGSVEFHHELSDGRPIWHAVKEAAARYNKEAKSRLAGRVALTRQT
jgi:site-specific DNA recombinase